jgi:hypothetical protein
MSNTTTTRDIRHLSITSERLRSLLHEAWKNGNDSFAPHHMEDGTAERYAYVDKVMIDNNFKRRNKKNESQ